MKQVVYSPRNTDMYSGAFSFMKNSLRQVKKSFKWNRQRVKSHRGLVWDLIMPALRQDGKVIRTGSAERGENGKHLQRCHIKPGVRK